MEPAAPAVSELLPAVAPALDASVRSVAPPSPCSPAPALIDVALPFPPLPPAWLEMALLVLVLVLVLVPVLALPPSLLECVPPLLVVCDELLLPPTASELSPPSLQLASQPQSCRLSLQLTERSAVPSDSDAIQHWMNCSFIVRFAPRRSATPRCDPCR